MILRLPTLSRHFVLRVGLCLSTLSGADPLRPVIRHSSFVHSDFVIPPRSPPFQIPACRNRHPPESQSDLWPPNERASVLECAREAPLWTNPTNAPQPVAPVCKPSHPSPFLPLCPNTLSFLGP